MMKPTTRILPVLALGSSVLALSPLAHAQSDLEFALPDVLLLVDTSGSMSLTSVRDPANPDRYALPECGAYPLSRTVDRTASSLGGSATPPDRWAMLVNALTGSVTGLSCSSQSRNSAAFRDEFRLAGVDPYDQQYYLPYNRIVAKQGADRCTPGPSWDSEIRQQLQDNAIKWPSSATGGPIYWRQMGSDQPCTFAPQDSDGLLDQFSQIARFGLMTFDPLPSRNLNGTEVVGTGLTNGVQADYPSGVGDTWSYFPGWRTSSGGASQGWPGGCTLQAGLLEVGARNPAAPPWEGRLIGFGDPNANQDEVVRNNDRVQQALMAMRPYGATPIAAMLKDAVHFLLQDDTQLSDASGQYFWGGSVDPGVSSTVGEGCRKRFVILVTDGGPNLDLRPDCGFTLNGIPGQCPSPLPEDSAEQLANNNIPVYVIGFAITSSGANSTGTCSSLLSQANACSQLTSCTTQTCQTGSCAFGYCINNPEQEVLATCCKVKAIANKGGTEPLFTENYATLYAHFSHILSDLVKGTRSRTQPVFATGKSNYTGSTQDTIAASRFLSSFKTSPGDIFRGSLERERFVCEKPDVNSPPVPVLKDYAESSGDNFGKNMDIGKGKRVVYTVIAEPDANGRIQSQRSIRPFYSESTGGDSLGRVTIGAGSTDSKMVTSMANVFASSSWMDPRALLGNSTCPAGTACCFNTPTEPTPNADTCARRFLNLQLGMPTGNPDISYSRGSVFGAIMHTTPLVMSKPDSATNNIPYGYFETAMANRPPVLFAPTSDGQLHAFLINELAFDLNELWTFMPPAVLPRIGDQFPDRYHAAPQPLLDGALEIKDFQGRAQPDSHGRFLTVTGDVSRNPTPANSRWYSILVGAFGSSQGYYALDVSWPESNKTPPTGYVQGPRFLWQLTTDANGEPLFGSRSSPPAITSLYFQMPGESAPALHAVAILPGGFGGEPNNELEPNPTLNIGQETMPDSRLSMRVGTRRYSPTDNSTSSRRTLGGARSITIVRLDTGEIIRTFRRGIRGSTPIAADLQAPEGLYTADRITPAPFDAPIVGTPVAYPVGIGQPSDRAFIGDAEGRLWRVNLIATNPADWSVNLFHDAFPNGGIGPVYAYNQAAPIETPPILSVDDYGRLTIAMSTGDQRTLTRHGSHPVWSLREDRLVSGTKARVNWVLNHENSANMNGGDLRLHTGERVTGPMSMFDGTLYFTTYDPSSEDPNTCTAGESFLWGVHYLKAGTNAGGTPSDNPEVGPMPALDPSPPADPNNPGTPTPLSAYLRYSSLGEGSVAFGIGITQTPPCYETTQVTDPFLGGLQTTVSNSTPSSFQLLVQTGRIGETGLTETKVTKRNLRTPTFPGRIESWAGVFE